ncbi:MAG: hypothetical protein ACI3XI_05830 [Eubacteriales bacterium]
MRFFKRILPACFDRKDIAHNILFAIVALILIVACFQMQSKEMRMMEYSVGGEVPSDIYIRQFDAWMKGQVALDLPVDPKLEALENPYDPAARREAGASFYWDYAYYNGQFYSYFGIAPILTVHAPAYALTGKLPNIPMTCLILAIAAVFMTALAYREVVLRFIEKPNFWLFLLGLAGVVSASGVYLGVLCSDMYYVAVLSAQVFSMAFVFLAVRAMREGKLWMRMALLVLAALSLTLTVWSRPTVALICVAVFPFFIEFLCRIRRETLKDGVLTVCAFAVPLIMGAAAVMIYNAARFSSPFDFGSTYQLTVSDVSLNTLDSSLLFSAFFSYFLCPAWQTEVYPYIELRRQLVLPTTDRYIYADRACGAFAYGLPLGILLYPQLYSLEKGRGERDIAKAAVVLLTAGLAFGIAFSDFCIGGVNMRYIYDISLMLTLISIAVLMNYSAKASGMTKIAISALTALLCAVSVWTNIGVVMTFTAK